MKGKWSILKNYRKALEQEASGTQEVRAKGGQCGTENRRTE